MYFVQNAVLFKAPIRHHFLLKTFYTKHHKTVPAAVSIILSKMLVLFEQNHQNNDLYNGPSLSSFYALKII